MSYKIIPYQERYQQAVVDLILPIQQNEFHVPITLADQPDLQMIPSFYITGNGNFWVALEADHVVGTIALIDIGNSQGALRKMFVHHSHRGKDKNVAHLLFDELKEWCKKKQVNEIFLGTISSMHAAHRFYAKHGFSELPKDELPKNFPLMRVDNRFFKCTIH